jgi:NADPH:quinone reductase-like Zn-dependent oxidoreductase
MGLFIRGRAMAPIVPHRLVAPVTTPNVEKLASLRDFTESGRLTPAIDRTYPLREVPEAIRYLEVEHASGKIVITVWPGKTLFLKAPARIVTRTLIGMSGCS